jgi:hypothetical protein
MKFEPIEIPALFSVKELKDIIKNHYNVKVNYTCYGLSYLVDKITKNNSYIFYLKSDKINFSIIQFKRQKLTVILPNEQMPLLKLCKKLNIM